MGSEARLKAKLIKKHLPLFREALHEPEKRRERIMNSRSYPDSGYLDRMGYKIHEGAPKEQAAEGRWQVEHEMRLDFYYAREIIEKKRRGRPVHGILTFDDDERREYVQRVVKECNIFAAELWAMVQTWSLTGT